MSDLTFGGRETRNPDRGMATTAIRTQRSPALQAPHVRLPKTEDTFSDGRGSGFPNPKDPSKGTNYPHPMDLSEGVHQE